MKDLAAEHCPRCGLDLEERPPRSYAEMEGLLEVHEQPVVLRRAGWQERRLVERWIAVAFFAAILGIAVVGMALSFARG